MKFILLIGIACAAVALAACGGGDDSTEATTSSAAASKPASDGVTFESAPEEILNNLVPPKVRVPSGPPPSNLVVRELSDRSGALPEPGDEVGVQYVQVDYESGKTTVTRWGPKHLFHFRMGAGEVPKVWEIGLDNATVGDRLELLVPSSRTNGKGAQVYVIEVIEVKAK
jgi:peptidylprolyl isomerase